jgi:hypothetical protein
MKTTIQHSSFGEQAKQFQKPNRNVMKNLFILLAISTFIFSCSKDDPNAPYVPPVIPVVVVPPPVNNVIVGGMAEPIAQTPGNSIGPRPIIWKNGVGTYVTAANAPEGHKAVAFEEFNGETYFGGEMYVNGITKPMLINNTTVHTLSNNGKFATVNAIHTANSTIYSAGYSTDDTPNENYIATVWKGFSAAGTKTQYAGSNNAQTKAFGVDVVGNDLYVAGTWQATLERERAVVWINGLRVFLTNSNSNRSVASAVEVTGTTVYVTGYEEINGFANARLWKCSLTGANLEQIQLETTIPGATVPVPGPNPEGNYGLSVYNTGSITYVYGNNGKDVNGNVGRCWLIGSNNNVTVRKIYGEVTAPQSDINNYLITLVRHGYLPTNVAVAGAASEFVSGNTYGSSNGVPFTTPYYWKDGTKYIVETIRTNNGYALGTSR